MTVLPLHPLRENQDQFILDKRLQELELFRKAVVISEAG
jgi:hypothetical protein